jgi:hypothetical protein
MTGYDSTNFMAEPPPMQPVERLRAPRVPRGLRGERMADIPVPRH